LAGLNSCDITIEAGRLQAGGVTAFGGGGLTVNGGVVSLAGFGQFVNSLAGGGGVLEMAGGQLIIAQATSTTFNGEITGGGGNSALTILNTGTLTLGGPITGEFSGLNLRGGTLVLGGTNTYTGHTVVEAGLLQVDGSITETINVGGGTLGGSGTVGDVLVADNGALAPGASTGILHTGDLSLAAGADFFVELAGTAAGTGYDQVALTGTVNLAGANLAVSPINGFDPNPGDSFTILANDGSDAIGGTFAGLAQGATFSAGSTQFRINYTGGDGNDIVLTATTVSTTDPNGNTTFTTIDAQGNQPWSSQSSTFNNMGQPTGATVNYDDGTVQSAAFDATGQPWSQQNSVFDPQGQLTQNSVFYDDGSVQAALYDTTGQPWSQQNFVFDPQGQLTQNSAFYDDGSVQSALYDPMNQQPWSQQNFVHDPQGQLVNSSVFFDDGSLLLA
jgi:autotransporter-associated beta strand protein